MVRINLDLLRKKAEHNEGCISTLKEVTLHQHEIEKIENLDKLCRRLQILYLQGNVIPKIGVSRFSVALETETFVSQKI